MVLPHLHHHHHPSYSASSSSSLCYCSTGVGDPMFSASSNQANTSSLSDIFTRAGSGSGSGSASVTVAEPYFTLSSSGERRSMSANEGAGFSEAQWHELERQKNIYKYIMASVPVPSELLTPFPRNHPLHTNQDVTVAVAKRGSLQLEIASSTRNSVADLEPWRCKRTDGKKWRCSRNVIPDQKYCERHTHKTRPRSRKHVESSHHNDIRYAKFDASQLPRPYPQFYGHPINQVHMLSSLPSAPSSDHHRGMRWFSKEDDVIGTLNPEIHEAVQLKVGVPSRELKRGCNYDLNFMQKEPLVDQSFGALQGLGTLNQTLHNQETRQFVIEQNEDEAMGRSLTLSMAGEAIQESEGTNQHQWVSHEGPSWLYSTTPGGPLAEALCLGVPNNPSSSNTTSSCSRSSSQNNGV